MFYKTDLYLLQCLTNLHAGSGDSTYGIVDKEVQKDPIMELPVIHASSMKGAFRELFEFHHNQSIEYIFGSDSKAEGSEADSKRMKAGQYFFMEARLLFLPVRSNRKPFFFATSTEILQGFVEAQEDFGAGNKNALKEALAPLLTRNPQKGRPVIFSNEAGIVYLDEFEAQLEASIPLSLGDWPSDGSNIAIFHHDDLTEVAKRLPVIARNYLENGISGNLWYEEVVPRYTMFYFFVSRPDDNDAFENQIKDDKIKYKVQIGGNASVGYGLCKLLKF